MWPVCWVVQAENISIITERPIKTVLVQRVGTAGEAQPKAQGAHLPYPPCSVSCCRLRSAFLGRSSGAPSTLVQTACQPQHPPHPSLPPFGPSWGCPSPGAHILPSPRSPSTGRRRAWTGCQAWHLALLAQLDWEGTDLGSWYLRNPSGKGGGLAKTGKLLEAFVLDKLRNCQSLRNRGRERLWWFCKKEALIVT